MSYFHSFSTFLHMGHYAAYVWSAYGIVLGVLIVQIVLARRKLKRTMK